MNSNYKYNEPAKYHKDVYIGHRPLAEDYPDYPVLPDLWTPPTPAPQKKIMCRPQTGCIHDPKYEL